jgi:hypothetical protein
MIPEEELDRLLRLLKEATDPDRRHEILAEIVQYDSDPVARHKRWKAYFSETIQKIE